MGFSDEAEKLLDAAIEEQIEAYVEDHPEMADRLNYDDELREKIYSKVRDYGYEADTAKEHAAVAASEYLRNKFG